LATPRRVEPLTRLRCVSARQERIHPLPPGGRDPLLAFSSFEQALAGLIFWATSDFIFRFVSACIHFVFLPEGLIWGNLPNLGETVRYARRLAHVADMV
jgi:hypothetical protein